MNFADILRFYRRGAAERKVDQELTALLTAIEATKKGGQITVTLKIKPAKAGENETDIDIDVKATLPKVPLPTATFFLEDGKLSRTNPRQMDAFPEEAEGVASLDRARSGLTGDALAAHMAAG